jgi:hypothetical protein
MPRFAREDGLPVLACHFVREVQAHTFSHGEPNFNPKDIVITRRPSILQSQFYDRKDKPLVLVLLKGRAEVAKEFAAGRLKYFQIAAVIDMVADRALGVGDSMRINKVRHAGDDRKPASLCQQRTCLSALTRIARADSIPHTHTVALMKMLFIASECTRVEKVSRALQGAGIHCEVRSPRWFRYPPQQTATTSELWISNDTDCHRALMICVQLGLGFRRSSDPGKDNPQPTLRISVQV